MKNLTITTAIALAALCGCDNLPKLHIYTWSDYYDPELLEQFEKEHGCKVVIDTFDSNEAAFAKLKAGAVGYDIITPTSYIIPLMASNGIIKPIDLSRLPNVAANLDHRYDHLIASTNLKWSVPYAFSMTGIMYRRDKLVNPPSGVVGWSFLFDGGWDGRICMMNDHREVIGCALRELGFSANSSAPSEIAAATELAKHWKTAVRKMDNELYKNAIASSEMFAAMAYNSDAMQVMSEDDGVGFAIPQRTTCSFDEFCVSATSRNEDLAYAFIDFFYSRENAARNVEYIFTPMPVKGLNELVDSELKNRELALPSDEVLSRCETLDELGNEGNRLFNGAWDAIKAHRCR